MHLTSHNINTMFPLVVKRFREDYRNHLWIETESRNGPVRQFIEPLTLTYEKPLQRVLFNPERNCNPFFHLAESLWMLAGRNDIAFLTPYNARMIEYSDDGETQRAAYGYRWANYPMDNPDDQLESVIEELNLRPNSRRALISMWDPQDSDYLGNDVEKSGIQDSKDMPCNTQIYIQIFEGRLDLTVTNRSNDIIWGMLGANIVHFSFLQEYLAARLGVPVGRLHQFSTNPHIYSEIFSEDKLNRMCLDLMTTDYYGELGKLYPLVLPFNARTFIPQLIHSLRSGRSSTVPDFIKDVWWPMEDAWKVFKDKTNPARHDRAIEICTHIQAPDWRVACINYISFAKVKFIKNNPYAYIEDLP